MTHPTKLLNILTFSLIIGSGITVAMEKEATHTLMISTHMKHVAYATPEFHTTRTPSNLPSNIKDPIIRCTVTNTQTKKSFHSYIAAKYLFKPEIVEPLIEIHQNNKEYPFNGIVRCAHNPKLPGNNFLEQFRNVMTPFYETPEKYAYYAYNIRAEDPQELTIWNSKDFDKAELFKLKKVIIRVDDKIVHVLDKEKKSKVSLYINPKLPHKDSTISEEHIYGHGPNGCSNEEALIKSINTMITQ